MKINDIEYQEQNLVLNLEDNQKIDVFPDLRIPIDRRREYRVLSINLDEETGKIKIKLGIYRKSKQINCINVGLNEFSNILDEYGIL